MPFRRRPARRLRRRVRRARRSYGGGARGIARRILRPAQTFTETISAGFVNANTGGLFTASMNSVPQRTNYANLYRQFRINKLTVLIVPRFTAQEQNQLQANVAPGIIAYNQPRITYAINNSADQAAPTSELQVLEDNGCRMKVIDGKPFTLSCVPVANIGQQKQNSLTLDTVGVSKRRQYLSFDEGLDVVHNGIAFWVSQADSTGSYFRQPTAFDFFYKINFSVRDPR
jgi:hypothetical protein